MSGVQNISQPTTYVDAAGRLMELTIRTLGQPGVDPSPAPLPVLLPPPVVPPPVPVPPSPQTGADGISVENPNGYPTAPAFTVFALCYGEFPDMHHRFLSALTRTTPAREFEVRVFCNALGPASRAVVDPFCRSRATRVYRSEKNLFKYPAMRRMFHDPEAPISSSWIIWLDDDSMCDINPNWGNNLRQTIAAARAKDPSVALVGDIRRTDLSNPRHLDWLRRASWHKGRPTRGRQRDVPVPNGSSVYFVSGGCWAMKTSMIVDAQVPDVRLQHNGGDVCIGEQVYQSGGTMVLWNQNKQQVVTSSAPRRGVDQGVLHWVDKP